MADVPVFVKREMEKLHEIVGPLMKKASKYSLWSLPLISISVVNLIFLLFFLPEEYKSATTIIVFAIVGAFGLALSKEAKFQKKEIHKLSTDYIVKRINNSNILEEQYKKKYISLVTSQPLQAMHHFIQFLKEENRLR